MIESTSSDFSMGSYLGKVRAHTRNPGNEGDLGGKWDFRFARSMCIGELLLRVKRVVSG